MAAGSISDFLSIFVPLSPSPVSGPISELKANKREKNERLSISGSIFVPFNFCSIYCRWFQFLISFHMRRWFFHSSSVLYSFIKMKVACFEQSLGCNLSISGSICHQHGRGRGSTGSTMLHLLWLCCRLNVCS